MLLAATRPLLAALFSKDSATYYHSIRVSCLAPSLAVSVGCPLLEVNAVHIVALLHDIGKIGIPDIILSKDGSLTSEEWDKMKNHSIIGHQIIQKVQAAGALAVAEAVKHLHEHYCGSGYPDNLIGTGIPVLSRLVSVADCFDAIHTRRSYKSSFNVKDTLNIMEAEVGTKHDPEIFKALVKLVS
jgi:putative nucleotidyltransferase with HDIG domain